MGNKFQEKEKYPRKVASRITTWKGVGERGLMGKKGIVARRVARLKSRERRRKWEARDKVSELFGKRKENKSCRTSREK